MSRPDGDTERQDPSGAEPADERGAEWRRRRRLAEVFGDSLPDTTSDERDPAEGGDRGEASGDAWLRAQVPPHHGS